MRKIILFFLLIICFNLSCKTTVNDPADKLSSVNKLNIYISNDNYNTLMENKFTNVSVPADIYTDNSHIDASIEAQGTGSRFFTKWSFKVQCKSGKSIEGLSQFNLSTQTYDKTKIKTALASYLYQCLGFPVFYSSHAFVNVNDEPKGLYVLTEIVDRDFFTRRNLPVYELIKVEYGAKFTFNEKNDLEDNFEKKIPDDKNLSNLAEFIHAIDTTSPGRILTDLNKFIDVKEYLCYHAITSIMNNSDGFTNNFYLYKDTPLSPYKIIPWDFDKAFNPNANLGLWGESRIINKLFQNDSCLMMYKSILRNALNYFNEEKLFPIIESVYNNIKDAYYLDPFLRPASLELEVNYLKEFIKERRAYLLSNL